MINTRLKSAILERYPSQVAFAADLGLSESLLSRIVRGWRKPSEKLRKNICERLGVQEDQIFTEGRSREH